MIRTFSTTALRLVAVLALACALAAPLAGAATGPFYFSPSATHQCTGVAHCQASLGPWVVVPAHGEASFLVGCPARQGFIIAGTDSRASSSSVRVWFDGQLGAPGGLPPSTAPGGAALLFHAMSMDGKAESFQPILGCVSLIDQTKTATVSMLTTKAIPGVSPAGPIDYRARTIDIEPQSLSRVTIHCTGKEKLIGSWHGLAFQTLGPPPRSFLDASTVMAPIVGKAVHGQIDSQPRLFVPGSPLAKAQVGALCQT